MAQFKKSYKILNDAEFGSNPEKFLHQNPTEDFVTLGGIYEKYHRLKIDWNFVHKILKATGDMKRASNMLYHDKVIYQQVYEFFYKEYWLGLKLDEVQSQKICDEIFLSAVHIGKKNSIKLAQKLVGAQIDGYIGDITVKCLNNYNENEFDKFFDKIEIENYQNMMEKNEKLAFYKQGFINRANFV